MDLKLQEVVSTSFNFQQEAFIRSDEDLTQTGGDCIAKRECIPNLSLHLHFPSPFTRRITNFSADYE